jgi:hypothetical protein
MAAHHVILEYVISLHVMDGMMTATLVMKMGVKHIQTVIRPIAGGAKMPVRKIMAKQHVTSEHAGSTVILDMQTATSVLKPTVVRHIPTLMSITAAAATTFVIYQIPRTMHVKTEYALSIRAMKGGQAVMMI